MSESSGPDQELVAALVALGIWVESVSVRLTALENIVLENGITQEQLTQAIRAARDELPKNPMSEDLADAADFLRRVTKHQPPAPYGQ